MARQLIESLSGDFEPAKYHDTYREQVLEMIERKAQGEEIAVQPAAEEPARVPDLMAALEASLAAVKDRGASDGAAAAKPKKRAPRRRAAREEAGAQSRAKSRFLHLQPSFPSFAGG